MSLQSLFREAIDHSTWADLVATNQLDSASVMLGGLKDIRLKLCQWGTTFKPSCWPPTNTGCQVAASKIFYLVFSNFISLFYFIFVFIWIFFWVGESYSIQHEITFVTLFWLLYLIKLTKLLNAHEGARKRFSGRWEANCTKLAGSFKYSRGSLHWKHLNNRRLEGIRYDSKEKQPKLVNLWSIYPCFNGWIYLCQNG